MLYWSIFKNGSTTRVGSLSACGPSPIKSFINKIKQLCSQGINLGSIYYFRIKIKEIILRFDLIMISFSSEEIKCYVIIYQKILFFFLFFFLENIVYFEKVTFLKQ